MTAQTNQPLLDTSFPLPLDRPFTRTMALDVGLKDNKLRRLCCAGYLRRPMRNLYLPAQLPDTTATRVAALTLVVPEGCFVTDHTAAWLHAGDKALPPNAHLATPPISVFRPPKVRALRNGWAISGERTLLPEDLMIIDGILVTTPLCTGLDLGRLQRNTDVAQWGLDCMLGLDVFTQVELLAHLPRFKGQRGVVRLRVIAPWADGDAQSFGEAALRGRWRDAHIPRPRLQIPVIVNGRVAFLLDMGLEELLFAAEYDGEEFHTQDDDREHDEQRRGWLSRHRAWMIEEFRTENVFGTNQDATQRLALAYHAARSTLGERTILA